MKTEAEDTDYLLTAEDRCDACGAQAYVYVEIESGDLLFCLHHWKKYESKLSETAINVLDESERLLAR